ncbi:MAG: late competence development ComFB family protein [Leptolyngbya sp. SIO1D8]|nr:late competence development ComFB family protein [Leptolyngbya sp. SIO1D8]
MSNEKGFAHQKVYINVMELLVAEEVEQQLSRLPERVLKYIRRSEVETFALNRLPALYASSEKGLQHQHERAIRELKPKIASAVRQAFAAVQIDPIRLSQPIQVEKERTDAEAVLQALRDWLRSPDLNWKTALRKIQRLQYRGKSISQGSPRNSGESAASVPRQASSVPVQPSGSSQSTAWRPGTYGSRLSWKPHRNHSESNTGGFEDRNYQ